MHFPGCQHKFDKNSIRSIPVDVLISVTVEIGKKSRVRFRIRIYIPWDSVSWNADVHAKCRTSIVCMQQQVIYVKMKHLQGEIRSGLDIYFSP